MAQVTLRFYGRFVFAERFVGGKSQGLSVLAPAMQYGDSSCPAHQILMSVPRGIVDPQKSKVPPSSRLMAFPQPQVAEHFVWDLAGCNVRVDAKGAFDFKGRTKVADIAKLEAKQGRKAVLAPGNLKGSKRGPVTAAIRVPAGTAVARSVWRSVYYFVPQGSKKPRAFPAPVQHADIVEVKVDLPKGGDSLRLQLSGQDGAARSIVLRVAKETKAQSVVSFTHLCAQLPRVIKWDEEFGQYYQTLKTRPKPATRLIPEELPTAGEWGDCNLPGYISY